MFDQIEVWYGAPIVPDLSEPDATALERVQKALLHLDEADAGYYKKEGPPSK